MNNLKVQAESIKDELINIRRTIHSFAEIRFELPRTVEYVVNKLKEYGYEPKIVGNSGVTCTVGKSGKTFLLRADMDALPMQEETDCCFRSQTGYSHSCGHDAHTAMLLGAAKLLKMNENQLKGRVKFMFQPAEEILAGAQAMLDDGILKNPDVDAAFALHLTVGQDDSATGTVHHKSGSITFSADAFRVVVHGLEAHGSTPFKGIDAVTIAAHIILALQNIVDKEVSCNEAAVVLVGKMKGGTAVNTVGGYAELEITTRAKTPEIRAFLRKRVEEIPVQIAKAFRGEAIVAHEYGIAPLINNVELVEEIKEYCAEITGEENVVPMQTFSGSEDFCVIADNVPAALFGIGGGSITQGFAHSLHHASMILDEDMLPIGAAVYANCAAKWVNKRG